MTQRGNGYVEFGSMTQGSGLFGSGSGTAVLTPDSDGATDEPWSQNLDLGLLNGPVADAGDDLDDDEAYFLEDEDDNDEDADDDYDEEDDDDDDNDGVESDEDEEEDDEEL